ARNEAAPEQRNTEEQLEPYRRADDFREVTRGDRQFAQNPQEPDGGLAVMIAAGLREVASSRDAELDTEMLQQDRHEVGHHDDPEERVAEFGTAFQIGGPVSWIHVANGDQEARAREREHLAPDRRAVRDGNAAMDFGQALGRADASPG